MPEPLENEINEASSLSFGSSVSGQFNFLKKVQNDQDVQASAAFAGDPEARAHQDRQRRLQAPLPSYRRYLGKLTGLSRLTKIEFP